jgi:hypothetical protein
MSFLNLISVLMRPHLYHSIADKTGELPWGS